MKALLQDKDWRSVVLFRALFIAWISIGIGTRFEWLLGMVSKTNYAPILAFQALGIPAPTAESLQIVYAGALLAALPAIFGWHTRLFLILYTALTFYVLGSFVHVNMEVRPVWVLPGCYQLPLFVLLLLCCASKDSMRPLSALFSKKNADKESASGFRLDTLMAVKIAIGLNYSGNAVLKLTRAAESWLTGANLESGLLRYYVYSGETNELAFTLVQVPYLALALSLAVMFFELTYIVAVFIPRLVTPYLVGGVLFHIAILLIIGINFFPVYFAAYLVFLRWDHIAKLVRYFSPGKESQQQHEHNPEPEYVQYEHNPRLQQH